jgi:bifunctional DNase/RNase
MRRVTVVGVFVDPPDTFARVALQEIEPPYREVAIPVGTVEGASIAYAWRGIEPPRPLTHDLFSSVMRLFSVSLEVVEVTAVEGSTYLAQMTLVSGTLKEVLPCRPSDGIALALRQQVPVPILVEDSLLSRPG